MKTLSQRTRLIILLAYVSLLFCAAKIALGSWTPPTSERGLWFYSGLAALLLGNLIVTPFFTKPADAISYTVAGIVALLATNVWYVAGAGPFDRAVWLITMLYVSVISASGLISIALKDSRQPTVQRFSRSLYDLCDSFGSPKSIFSAIFLFAVIAFHRNNPREYITIGAAWAVLVGRRPLETLADLIKRWSATWGVSLPLQPIGEVVAHQTPGIALIRQADEFGHSFGKLFSILGSDGALTIGLAADYIGWAEGRWLRVILLDIPQGVRNALTTVIGTGEPHQSVFLVPDEHQIPTELRDWFKEHPVIQKRDKLVGLVAPDTDISKLRFEIVRTDLDLAEGRLVEVRLGRKMVLYQIVNGLTKEEIIQQKNMYGYVRADAKKIGCWNADKRGFETVRWVPNLNEPVFLVDVVEYASTREAIGHFPGTNHPVEVEINSLVTHNAAILGILGSGKSFLALELVERMVAERLKVVCLDLTNQYAHELRHLYNGEAEEENLKRLGRVGIAGRTNFQKNVEEGGSVNEFAAELKKDLSEFLADQARFAKIYNPATFEVWRQDSKPYADKASMASLTPTEITRIIVETLLELVQDNMSDRACACIVFEEAHSLIPEWNAVATEGDKAATNGTAKAILQGRKYGLGCIVVTQRTANVTKSILNQCNTVFALRVFDATGMEFLKNYIGEDYAAVLSTLEDRHAVVFGRASSCRNPVLVRLNDREHFIRTFRAAAPEAAPAEESH